MTERNSPHRAFATGSASQGPPLASARVYPRVPPYGPPGTPAQPWKRRLRSRRLWVHLIAYVFILIALLAIGVIAYGSYAFSRYSGVILPGVHVDNVALGGMSQDQARTVLLARVNAMKGVPVVFEYGRRQWHPSPNSLGLHQDVDTTVQEAYALGRSGGIIKEFIDRLPLGRHRSVPLSHSPVSVARARFWLESALVPVVHRSERPAALSVGADNLVHVSPSREGLRLNAQAALTDILRSQGELTIQRFVVPINRVYPGVTTQDARAIAARVNGFLKSPPILELADQPPAASGSSTKPHVEKYKLTRQILAPLISFRESSTTISPHVDSSALTRYLVGFAQDHSVRPTPADVTFDGGTVTVVSKAKDGWYIRGRVLSAAVLKDYVTLRRNAHVRVAVRTVSPPSSTNNPASLGVTSLLGEGATSLAGAPASRAAAVNCIAAQVNNLLIQPGQQISFDYYANRPLGSSSQGCAQSQSGEEGSWSPTAYRESESVVNGKARPGADGAMQQVATTFFRALYDAGLPLLERHAHAFRFPWYEPPVGLDAVVYANGDDVRFQNSTGGYVWIVTRVEPLQDKLYVYVYGRDDGWDVTISQPSVSNVVQPGEPVWTTDPSLPKGQTATVRLAEPGEDVTITRDVKVTIKGKTTARSDTLFTRYQPQVMVRARGSKTTSTPTPTPTPSPTATPTPTPTPTSTHTG
jgi:vancomycin resistance protein YoaR